MRSLPSVSTALVSVDAILVRRTDANPHLIRAPSAACRTCGMCGTARAGGSAEIPEDAAALRISLPGRSLMIIAMSIYGIPFAGLLAGSLLAAAYGAGDAIAAAAAAAGCLNAIWLSGRLTRHVERRARAALAVNATGESRAARAKIAADFSRALQ